MQFLKNYQKSFRNSNFRNSQVYRDEGLAKGRPAAHNDSITRRSSSNFFLPNPQIQQKNLPNGFFRQKRLNNSQVFRDSALKTTKAELD